MIRINSEHGDITISNAVFTTITGAAATNCFGVKGMAYRSMTDGLVHLLRPETMSKGVKVIYNDGHVAECPAEDELHVIRHTAAHILAQAIKHLYPDAHFAYGPATENAVTAFQRLFGLAADGIVGPRTWERLVGARLLLR